MALDAKTLENGAEPLDAPPAYEQAMASSSSSSNAPALAPEKSASTPTPTGPTTARLGTSRHGAARSGFGASHSGPASSWLQTLGLSGESKTDRDVKATVLSLVRDLVKSGHSPDAVSILNSCSDACTARGLSIQEVLQEPSIEGHTPLHWAILKAATNKDDARQLALVDLLMSFPLDDECVRDARLACLLASSDALLERVQRAAGASVTDELLLGAPPQDRVQVEHAPHDPVAFAAALHFAHFQTRMRVSKAVRAEFIARGRIWYIAFLVSGETERFKHKDGTWLATVGLVEPEVLSPPTPLDARLIISPLAPRGRLVQPTEVALKSAYVKIGKTSSEDGTGRTRAIALLDNTGLEFDGCPHLNADGSLDALLEARLEKSKSDSECVIV